MIFHQCDKICSYEKQSIGDCVCSHLNNTKRIEDGIYEPTNSKDLRGTEPRELGELSLEWPKKIKKPVNYLTTIR